MSLLPLPGIVALTRAHSLDKGGDVGTLRTDINGFRGNGGCVDPDKSLDVTPRKNEETVRFRERAGLDHRMMLRWTLHNDGPTP